LLIGFIESQTKLLWNLNRPVAKPDILCAAQACPATTAASFYAGTAGACTASACSAHFSFCPDEGAHTEGSLVAAAYGATAGGPGDGISSSVGFQFTVGSVNYTSVTNVISHMRITDDTCDLKGHLARGDWADAMEVYENGAMHR
jgi:hypothetical protein